MTELGEAPLTAVKAPVRTVAAERRMAAIVPEQNVVGHALVLVIAIMTFLSCLMFGGVTLVRDTATVWEAQISREATIQIKPVDGLDMDAALTHAAQIARGFAGVKDTRIVDRAATARLLEPWLGSGLDIDALPVPRLVIVTIDQNAPPDFPAMRSLLVSEIASASLDDHRTWVDRLVTMARTTVSIGIAILVLILSATVLSVIFATRGAMATNRPIVEVLHFIGAKSGFIAGQFQRHFLMLGLEGGVIGGGLAMLLFGVAGIASSWGVGTASGEQVATLFGSFALGWGGYLAIVAQIVLVAVVTAIASRRTVNRTLETVE